MPPAFKSLLVITLLLCVSFWYFTKQAQVSVADGKGWDGVTYHQMYLHYKGVDSKEVYDAPFNKRIGLPWLASKLPLEATQSFLLLNLCSGLVACVFVFLTLRSRVRTGLVLACMLPMACYIFSPIRFPNFYPFTVDPPATMLCALAAFLISRKYYLPAGIAFAASAFFRESGIYFALALGVILCVSEKRLRPAGASICLIAGAGAVAVAALQLPGDSYSQVRTVLSLVWHKILSPLGLLRSSICISMTLAPFLICRARRVGEAREVIDLQHVIARCFLLLCLAMALVGGHDTTRIFYVGYPLYVLVLADWVGVADTLTVVLSSVAGMIANRFCEMIPQPSAVWPDNDVSGLFSITPDYSHPGIVAVFFVYWAAWWFVIVGPGRPMIDTLLSFLGQKISPRPL